MISLRTNEWEIINIDTVLFDKDGTFIDLHFFWGKMTELRVERIIAHFNLPKEYYNELCLSLGFDTSTKCMLKDGITALYSRMKIIEIFKKHLEKYNVFTTNAVIEKIFDDVSSIFYLNIHDYTKPIEGAIDFIKLLKINGVKCGIVTSDSIKSTQLTLEHFMWKDLFDVVIGRESTKENKESGVGVKIALEKLDSLPANTVMIGDAPMDYIAAKNAGINNTILVATGQLSKKELESTCTYVVHSLKDVTIY